jgi:hypothetical protein
LVANFNLHIKVHLKAIPYKQRSAEQKMVDKRNLLSEESPFINWVHILGIAPAIAALKYKPNLVKYAPLAAGAIVMTHGWMLYQKTSKAPMKQKAI